jgi:hypothetical protein
MGVLPYRNLEEEKKAKIVVKHVKGKTLGVRIGYLSGVVTPVLSIVAPQSRQSARLFSSRPNWDPPLTL